MRVHRIVCALDCGQVVNPDIVSAQVEGSIIFGLTATFFVVPGLIEGDRSVVERMQIEASAPLHRSLR